MNTFLGAAEEIFDRKKGWLQTAVITFSLGVIVLGAVLVIALLSPQRCRLGRRPA